MQTATNDTLAHERGLNSLSNITLIVTLAGVTMTFGALITVFLMRALRDQDWTHIQLPGILWISTAFLVASSFVFENARRHLIAGEIAVFNRKILWTLGLATLFLLGQIAAGIQILRSGVILTNNPHSWFIFLFGGLHALHILGGLIGFVVLYMRTREAATGPRYQMGTRAGARGVGIFWHYMDAMWLLLFALLIFWRR